MKHEKDNDSVNAVCFFILYGAKKNSKEYR